MMDTLINWTDWNKFSIDNKETYPQEIFDEDCSWVRYSILVKNNQGSGYTTQVSSFSPDDGWYGVNDCDVIAYTLYH